MKSAAETVKAVRARSGLSGRALAERAGVAYSTLARIESGRVDPTTGMLARLLAGAGEELVLATMPLNVPRLASLADAWHHDGVDRQDRPDWTRVRGFLDYLRLHPEAVGPSTHLPPPPSGSEFMDNLLAAIAEKSCREAGVAIPAWTHQVAPLSEPWITRSTPKREAATRAATPHELAIRGISMTRDSLWRDPESVGV